MPGDLKTAADVVTGIAELATTPDRLGNQWGLRYATVISVIDAWNVFGRYDNETTDTDVPMISLVGRLVVGTRVAVIYVPPSGNYIMQVITNPYPRLIGRAERFTSSTGAAGAQGVLRLDNILVPANHLVLCDTSNVLIFSTVAGDTGSIRFAYTTSGTAATTGSTLLTLWNSSAIATTGGGTGAKLSEYLPVLTADYRLSLLLYTLRITGTGTINLFAAAGALSTQLRIWDWGPVPADTGVII